MNHSTVTFMHTRWPQNGTTAFDCPRLHVYISHEPTCKIFGTLLCVQEGRT